MDHVIELLVLHFRFGHIDVTKPPLQFIQLDMLLDIIRSLVIEFKLSRWDLPLINELRLVFLGSNCYESLLRR